jgi:hypothetical protein
VATAEQPCQQQRHRRNRERPDRVRPRPLRLISACPPIDNNAGRDNDQRNQRRAHVLARLVVPECQDDAGADKR